MGLYQLLYSYYLFVFSILLITFFITDVTYSCFSFLTDFLEHLALFTNSNFSFAFKLVPIFIIRAFHLILAYFAYFKKNFLKIKLLFILFINKCIQGLTFSYEYSFERNCRFLYGMLSLVLILNGLQF